MKEKEREKMKKVTELVKELTNENINDTLKNIIANDDIILKSLTEREKFAVLLFRELKKAVDTDKFELVLDCNYARSKFSVLKVDYYRVIDKITKTSHIQVYTRLASNQANFRLCTSCKEIYIEQLQSLGFVVKRDKKTNRAKTSEKLNISYNDIVKTIQDVLNVFTSYESAESAQSAESAESAKTSAKSSQSAESAKTSAESAKTSAKSAESAKSAKNTKTSA